MSSSKTDASDLNDNDPSLSNTSLRDGSAVDPSLWDSSEGRPNDLHTTSSNTEQHVLADPNTIIFVVIVSIIVLIIMFFIFIIDLVDDIITIIIKIMDRILDTQQSQMKQQNNWNELYKDNN